MSIQILGTGAYQPEKIITNDDLSKMVDTSDEWIMPRVGIHERRVSVNETTAEMAEKAARKALDAAGVSPEELDLIIAATVSSDSICPSLSARVQMALGAHCPAFDLNSACSGFLFALDTAAAFIARGGVQHALVIGAERLSRVLDWTDRSTCVIFGDGSGAFVVAPGEQMLASRIYTQGNDSALSISAGQDNSPFFERELAPYKVVMNGQETFKFAVRRLEEDIKLLCAQAGITPEQLDWIVPHQANTRIIDLCARRLKLPAEKFYMNIERCGNTSSASVPVAFDELARSGKLKKGDLVALSAFGGGLSSAGCIIKW